MGSELGWLSDERVLGRPLSERLRRIARTGSLTHSRVGQILTGG